MRKDELSDAKDQNRTNRTKSPWAYLSVGIQFAVTVSAFSGLGYWLDGTFEWSPWGIVFCSTFGVAAGTYHFLKEVG